MGWLHQDPSGNWHVGFRFGGRVFKRSLKTKNRRDAETRLTRLDETIRLIESGRIELPDDADPAMFLLSDGKLNDKLELEPAKRLHELFADWLKHLPSGAMEDSSLRTIKIHMRHLERILGRNFEFDRLEVADLQRYVEKRSKEPGQRGRNVSAATIKKDLVTFSTIWGWAFEMQMVNKVFPNKGIRYPKTKEKPPFQTWDEIKRKVDRGGLTEAAQADLWDCLYLNNAEIKEFLNFVLEKADQASLHPMVAFAAYTGARRSELLRVEIDDIDWEGDSILIRERKRIRGKLSTRRVPLAKPLRPILYQYAQTVNEQTFFLKRDYRTGKYRPFTRDEAHDVFQNVIAGSKWGVLRGWHVLRHSFASNSASRGVDQRLIDSWLGHQNEETVRRYRHLFPTTQKVALDSVFEESS